MIEIIKEDVLMPKIEHRKFVKECKNYGCYNETWFVINTEDNTIRYKGNYKNTCLVWHNLNKKHYRDITPKKE